MRLWAPALTIVSLALVVPPPAETRLDPVAALRVQLESGDGVAFTSVTSTRVPERDKPMISRRSGVHELAHGKVVASDYREDQDGTDPERTMAFPDRSYEQSTGWRRYLPEGKNWVFEKTKDPPVLTCGLIRLSNPATLKVMLAGARTKRPGGVYDGTRTTLHEGVITLGEVAQVDPGLRIGLDQRLTDAEARIRVDWKLWIGRDQLVHRCHASSWLLTFLGEDDFDPMHIVEDLRLSRWGHPADLKPPPADQAASLDQLDSPEEAPVTPRPR
ncbi:hypothetical protein [Nonomuraea candida]|uniref:hypothetical protein n=1 Tax=Nonomuraea candida TaxID=359159 RepID=UPI0005B8629B|nr:hypothetical protein [Nonomuraea candida]